ncbi:hypothetical protein BLL42_21170 [Pseudomonas frederiksbergensis]|uniref:Uncharacterized protein n=1 Tax=Pseudomonas frederiksbergensis TaxID=104087 RepID=A0A1J0EQL9_9PSED|nr:hypothetical protein BLL42_21170 [Pseudomonas frederiksbergensis]
MQLLSLIRVEWRHAMPDGLINGCKFCGGSIGLFDVLAVKKKIAACPALALDALVQGLARSAIF